MANGNLHAARHEANLCPSTKYLTFPCRQCAKKMDSSRANCPAPAIKMGNTVSPPNERCGRAGGAGMAVQQLPAKARFSGVGASLSLVVPRLNCVGSAATRRRCRESRTWVSHAQTSAPPRRLRVAALTHRSKIGMLRFALLRRATVCSGTGRSDVPVLSSTSCARLISSTNQLAFK